MPQQLLFLEFNEINFESVAYYADRGRLPNLKRLIANGWQTTTSEDQYENIEPWIQWVTAHTGKTLAEHGVFRLGDIVKTDLPQIWEQLEASGLRVGAISPMNAKHRVRSPAFFVPDPWTPTPVSAPKLLKALYRAIAQAVNDNAQSKVSAGSLAVLLAGLGRYALLQNYPTYCALAFSSISSPWRKAMLLDLLLADVFVRQVKATTPHFATLFLNAGAHIQHHYMFCSPSYDGPNVNPDWYVARGADPVGDVYALYDRILGTVRAAFPEARIMLATGLHQVPHGEATYYWRLKNHAHFLRRIGVDFLDVEPRMSRDFLVKCEDAEGAARAALRLRNVRSADGAALFEVDNRGADLFVMLTYPRDIGVDFVFEIDGERYSGLKDDFAFVALKNGEHSGIGYFLDTGAVGVSGAQQFPLTEIPSRILAAMGLDPTGANSV
jgi:hypothetical protein